MRQYSIYCNMLRVSDLYIYPVKSLGGFRVNDALLTDRGFSHDRRWMLVDRDGRFMTQRVFPQMAMLQAALEGDALKVYHKKDPESHMLVSLDQGRGEKVPVRVWEDTCEAELVCAGADQWLSDMLGVECRLVHMPNETLRLVDPQYAHHGEITSFSDAYPLMIIGQASLDDLNQRLSDPVSMDRFRPNIVFTGGDPYEEDTMPSFTINGIQFLGVKPCARCVLTTVNQATGEKGKEPLQTLSTYRQVNNKVLFGMNLLHDGEDVIHVGDTIIRH